MQITIHDIKEVTETRAYLSGVQEYVRSLTIETETDTIMIRLYSEKSLDKEEKKGFWDKIKEKL